MNLPNKISRVSVNWKVATLALFFVTAGYASVATASSADGPLGTWSVEYIADRPVIDFSPASITLGADGRISGNSSCNRFTGSYEVSGKSLKIGPLGVTRMACPAALMDQEQRFLKTIERVASWNIANGLLHLHDADGKPIFRAARKATGKITVSATYRERIALPPGAEFEAVLEDVSLADVAAKRMGEVRIRSLDGVPVHFEIPYDPGRIDSRFSYTVRATIRVDGQLWATTDQHYPVLTRSGGNDVQLVLRSIPR